MMSQSVSACEAAWHLCKFDIVTFSWKTDFFFTDPPNCRTVPRRNKYAGGITAPIDLYTAREEAYAKMTMKTYFRLHEVIKKKATSEKKRKRKGTHEDQNGLMVVRREDETSTVVCFSDPHPVRHTEAFFYNVLLEKVPFRHESELINSRIEEDEDDDKVDNLSKTYFEQCQLERLFSTFKELRSLLKELYVATLASARMKTHKS